MAIVALAEAGVILALLVAMMVLLWHRRRVELNLLDQVRAPASQQVRELLAMTRIEEEWERRQKASEDKPRLRHPPRERSMAEVDGDVADNLAQRGISVDVEPLGG